MKIGIVTEYFYPTLGGISENIYHFTKELLWRGHDFRIITGFRGKVSEDVDEEVRNRMIFIGRNVPVFFNGSCGRLTVGFGLTKKIKQMLKSECFDLIHLHSPLFPTLPVLTNVQANAPIVSTYHTCSNNTLLYRHYHGRLQKMIDRMACSIAVSSCCAKEQKQYFDMDFQIIPNGVDVDWWRTDTNKIEKFMDGRINIIFLGRPDTRNGLDTLITAFARLHRRFKKTRLIVVGDGPLRFYFKKLVPKDVKDAVSFEGYANLTRRDYVATADIFCFTPTIASFGVTILEGMSAGKAIIASDIEAFRALVRNNESALLVPPSDEDALVRTLERLILDSGLRTRLAKKASEDVLPYDWKNVADMHIELYERIIRQ